MNSVVPRGHRRLSRNCSTVRKTEGKPSRVKKAVKTDRTKPLQPKRPPVAKWLMKVRVDNDLDQDELAEIVGLSRSMVNMMERGERVVQPDVIAAIMDTYPDTPDAPIDGVLRMTGSAPRAQPEIIWELPYAGIVPCSGTWGDPLDGTESKPIDPDFTGPNRFICRVAGDSCWPALKPGDITVWEKDTSPAPGVIVLAQRMEDSACTVKELGWDEVRSRHVLIPVNPLYEAPPDGEGWQVAARLIGVVRTSEGPKKTWLEPDGLQPKHLIPPPEK